MLTDQQIEQFITDGFVRIERAFSPDLAERCRELLWQATGCDPANPATWTKPVVWLGDLAQAPFVEAANTPALHAAFDQLAGAGNWEPRRSLGSFPIRFPCAQDTGDTGWHIDASFAGPDSSPQDFLSWRVNVHSRGRALLMLFLFSEVGELDAPTRIRQGSHWEMARLLAPYGETGLALREMDFSGTAHCPEVLATGPAGTVFLCHPFLVHAAQLNRGTQPRFLAQPPLIAPQPFTLTGKDADAYVPVERAIRLALIGEAESSA